MLSNPSGVSLPCISSFTIEIVFWLVDFGLLELGILVQVCPTKIIISFVGNSSNYMLVAKPHCDISQDFSAVATKETRKVLVISLRSGAMESTISLLTLTSFSVLWFGFVNERKGASQVDDLIPKRVQFFCTGEVFDKSYLRKEVVPSDSQKRIGDNF